jgi:rhodanese-related sulfurtransferase
VSRRRRAILAAGAAVLAVAGGLAWWRGRGPDPAGSGRVVTRPDARAPEGTRVLVEVLNAGGVRGAGRQATQVLRDHGFDVVYTGNAQGAAPAESTLVLARSGHLEWADRVAKARGGARVEARPDSSRYLDVTVLLGRGWRPPAEPFRP